MTKADNKTKGKYVEQGKGKAIQHGKRIEAGKRDISWEVD